MEAIGESKIDILVIRIILVFQLNSCTRAPTFLYALPDYSEERATASTFTITKITSSKLAPLITKRGQMLINIIFFLVIEIIKYLIKPLSDALIRQYLSTSPSVEKPDFAHGTKAAIKVIMQHPEPLKTIFEDKPRKYKRKSDGFWELIDVRNSKLFQLQ